MKQLTERQKEVAAFIENYFDTNGYAPSVRDVANHFGFSPKAAFDHMTALKKKNVIKSTDNLPRGMTIVNRTTPSTNVVLQVPILGTTAAGVPIDSVECYDGYIPVPQSMVGSTSADNLYALRVRGDSMIDDGINDGDLAIMVRTKSADNGDIVAASKDDNYGITLKHFFRLEPGKGYELRPANCAYEPIRTMQCDIHGKLLMVIRQYATA